MGLLGRGGKAIVVGAGMPRRKQRDAWRARARVAGLVLLFALVAVLSLRHGNRKAARRTVLVDIEQIASASRLFRLDHGRCPRDPDELAEPPVGAPRYLARPPRDPWGRPYFYRCPGRWGEDEVDVASPGPDGDWEGGDDITTDL